MPVISIVGPTASGKTELAAKVAQHFLQKNVEVAMISLDARQIYREFPILSGADRQDLPRHKNFQIYNLADKSIDDEFSLGLLTELVQKVWQQAQTAQQQVLLVGGTLLYHQRVLADNDLTRVPPDDNVRFAAENMSVAEIQAWLQKVSSADFAALNESDRQNPRRLVRKLEIAIYRQTYGAESLTAPPTAAVRQVYLQPHCEVAELPAKIQTRVQKRFAGGAVEEVAAVLKTHAEILSNKQWQSRMPLGFTEIAQYLVGEITAEACQEQWSKREWQYAKRQLTFLKKLLFDHHADLIDEREILAD